ncbi:MAG: hypothetical protein GXZ02_02310 [Clostridiales bacterium]|nr:hypothetical protein [Clostridiales bacterium]
MKKRKKSKSILLGLASTAAAGAGLAYLLKVKMEDDAFKGKVKQSGAAALFKTLEGINAVLPKLPRPSIEEYVSENFYEGHAEFRDTSVRGAKWKFGYARASLTPDDYLLKDYYLGGFLNYPPNTVKSVLDDIAVRAVCLDDGSGRGAAVFAVIVCIGLSGTDVRSIRALLADFAKANNIVSINISSSHCHSGIDTQGIWGVLPDILKNNVVQIKRGNFDNLISGRDPEFMDSLHKKTAGAITQAFADQKAGKLMFKTFNDLKYSHDKRKVGPKVVDENMTKLHFIPDDGSAETVGVLMAAHPTALDATMGELSADYIYYIEEEVNKSGSNFIFFQGPQLAVGVDRSFVSEDTPGRGFQAYGREIGKYLLGITVDEEEKILPILNVRNAEVFVPAGNFFMLTLLGAGIVNNQVVKTGRRTKDIMFVTEVGYVELGKTLRLAMMPGEFAPEMLLGGTSNSEESCTGMNWDFPPMKKMLADGTDLIVIGLCNDSIGYILPDNDYGCIFDDGHYEEAVSAGAQTGSSLVGAFETLVDDCGRLNK